MLWNMFHDTVKVLTYKHRVKSNLDQIMILIIFMLGFRK